MDTDVWQHRFDHRTSYSSSYSMKHEGLGKMMHGTNNRNHFALVEKLPHLTTNFPATGVTEESDADDYYPFVIGHGSSFKVIDPKVYKQLRRHNIQQQKVPIKVADCAKKSTIASHKTPATTNTKFSSSSDSADDADEYCELSPLAKAPPIKLSTLRSQPADLKSKNSLAKLSSFERRLYTDCYYGKTKACLVESQPSSPTSRPTTRLVDSSSLKSERVEHCSQWTNDKQEPLLCGVEADELIDYASCMCCVKVFSVEGVGSSLFLSYLQPVFLVALRSCHVPASVVSYENLDILKNSCKSGNYAVQAFNDGIGMPEFILMSLNHH
ncbi:hypothetical protein ACROYT_G006055 [Oculina patagonica]